MKEAIEWKAVADEMPDVDATVMVFHAAADEPVWLGFFDGELWRSVDAEVISVSHWAEMPHGPAVKG